MTQEANKLKRKQDLKKYLVFALMFAVFVGSLWLIFAPSEKERKEQEQSVGFNTELPDPRNAGIVGDKKTAYEQDMMRRKQEEKMRTLEELSFGTENRTARYGCPGRMKFSLLMQEGRKRKQRLLAEQLTVAAVLSNPRPRLTETSTGLWAISMRSRKKTRRRRPCARKSRNYAIRWCSSIAVAYRHMTLPTP